jgi:hypothetical protein
MNITLVSHGKSHSLRRTGHRACKLRNRPSAAAGREGEKATAQNCGNLDPNQIRVGGAPISGMAATARRPHHRHDMTNGMQNTFLP